MEQPKRPHIVHVTQIEQTIINHSIEKRVQQHANKTPRSESYRRRITARNNIGGKYLIAAITNYDNITSVDSRPKFDELDTQAGD